MFSGVVLPSIGWVVYERALDETAGALEHREGPAKQNRVVSRMPDLFLRLHEQHFGLSRTGLAPEKCLERWAVKERCLLTRIGMPTAIRLQQSVDLAELLQAQVGQ